MKTRLIEVAGLHLKISLNNNILLLSCNMDGHSHYETRRIVRNSILSESEIFEKIDSDWVSKVFAQNIKQINNVIHSNVSLIPVMNRHKPADYDIAESVQCFKLL